MRFGVNLMYEGMSDPEFLADAGHLAEDLGFDSVWIPDHIVMPLNYQSKYPYSATGKLGVETTTPFPECLVTLTFLAAVTTKVELATGVMILPLRNPVLLAKQTASLDRLAGGRLRLGIGLGWLKEEFDAVGVPFERRARRTDEYLDAMHALWQDRTPGYSGEFVDFRDVEMEPGPTRESGVSIVVGGHT